APDRTVVAASPGTAPDRAVAVAGPRSAPDSAVATAGAWRPPDRAVAAASSLPAPDRAKEAKELGERIVAIRAAAGHRPTLGRSCHGRLAERQGQNHHHHHHRHFLHRSLPGLLNTWLNDCSPYSRGSH